MNKIILAEEGFPNLELYEDGTVYNTKMLRWLKPDGVGRFSLSYSGKRKLISAKKLKEKYFPSFTEVPKPIVGFEQYLVFEDGSVYSKISYKFLKPQSDKDGYLIVTLYDESGEHKKRVSRLVALAFLENPNDLPEVNHKDEDKKNNKLENLEWCSIEYNRNYGTRVYRCNCLR